MRELILGQISDQFDPERHIPISPACFIGKENVYSDWQDLPFEKDPFNSTEMMADHIRLTVQYSDAYIRNLTSRLNRINSTGYSDKYWRLLVYPWLLTLVQTTWERQLRIESILKSYSTEAMRVVLIKDNFNWNFKNTLAHQVEGLMTHEYNHWLYSRLIENQLPEKWVVQWIELEPCKDNPAGQTKSIKQKLASLFKYNVMASTVHGVDPMTALLFELVLLFRSSAKKRSTYDNVSLEGGLSDVNLDWSLDWDKLVNRTLPICFTKISQKMSRKILRRKYLVGPILWYNEEQKIKLAEAVNNGCQLVVSQHGGSYGTSLFYAFKKAIEYDQFKFISWGWKEQGEYNGNVIPLPAPILSKYKYKRENEKIILVTNWAMMYSYRISETPQALQQLAYRDSKVSFIDTISREVFDHLYYRPPLYNMGSIADHDYFRDKYKTMHILKGSLHKETMRCRLLVLDHPDTTLNVALSANIPTICFWDEDIWAMCEQAEPLFEQLRDVGILFSDGEQAARKVDEVWSDVDSWWKSVAIQSARQAWVEQYALKHKSWRTVWLKELWAL